MFCVFICSHDNATIFANISRTNSAAEKRTRSAIQASAYKYRKVRVSQEYRKIS